MIHKHYRFQDPEVGAAGGAEDRGDTIEPVVPVVVTPDPAEVAAEAAAAALKKELDDKAAAEAKGDKADPDADPDAETDPKKKDSRIPLSRHKEILEKEREQRAVLERQLAQFQKGGEVADTNAELTKVENNIMALEKQYATLLTDGELDKATAVMAQIRQSERQMSEYRSDIKIQAAESRATEKARFNVALERIEASFPVLNPDHADYDEAMEAEVVDLKAAYEQRGMTPTQAMQKAVRVLIGTETAKQDKVLDTQPNVSAKDVATERKADATKKVADAVAKTPAQLAKGGLDGDKLGGGRFTPEQVMGMNQKDFAALSDHELAQMRGDTI